ncbi:tyrosine-type recombinase/integrase [Chloroflexota bacterium]
MVEKLNNIPNGKELIVIPPIKNIPVKKTYRVSEYTRPISFVSEDEVYRLADAAMAMRDGERNYLLIMILFQCALRVTEAVKLKVKDKVMASSKHLLMIKGKGNKPRLVAIPTKLSHHLGDYAQRQALGLEDRYFPITRVRAWQIVKDSAEKAGINRRVYCHLLRHSGAIARLKRTGNPKSLQIHLGHADMKMTMRYLATMQTIESLAVESMVEFDK